MNRLLQSSEDEHVTQLCIFGCSLEFFRGKCLFVCLFVLRQSLALQSRLAWNSGSFCFILLNDGITGLTTMYSFLWFLSLGGE
jgi:hypothetical protein